MAPFVQHHESVIASFAASVATIVDSEPLSLVRCYRRWAIFRSGRFRDGRGG